MLGEPVEFFVGDGVVGRVSGLDTDAVQAVEGLVGSLVSAGRCR